MMNLAHRVGFKDPHTSSPKGIYLKPGRARDVERGYLAIHAGLGVAAAGVCWGAYPTTHPTMPVGIPSQEEVPQVMPGYCMCS